LIETLKEILAAAPSSSRPIVASLTSVDKNYGDVRAMCAVDLQVRAGEVVAFASTNGEPPPCISEKTTQRGT
jgi:hypothetical protein